MKDDAIEVMLEVAPIISLRPSHAKTCREFKKKKKKHELSVGHAINPRGFVADD